MVLPPNQIMTLVDLLQWRAQRQPEQCAYTFLSDGETSADHLSYAELDARAQAIGALLQSRVAVGARALLLYPAGLDYIAGFFGCLYAGVVAVPAYPPSPNPNRPMSRIHTIVADSQASVALTTTAIKSTLERRIAETPYLKALEWSTTDRADAERAASEHWRKPDLSGDTLAFLQYTSGSTAHPKGVMISHKNLLHNMSLMQRAWELGQASQLVNWLPLYHDMGLIAGMLLPCYVGMPATLMAPVAFLQRPFRWLHAISRMRATISLAPNFAYDLCVSKIPAEQRAELDLSTWKTAVNGAEPVRAETLERFTEAFASCGFRSAAVYPGYGLAEGTLFVSGGKNTSPPIIRTFQGTALLHNSAVVAATESADARSLVGCGQPLWDQRIVIVDPETGLPNSPGRVGEIWLAGPSVGQGYWRRPTETKDTFQAQLACSGEGPFLRTGDLGFFDADELFVTGRLKDLLIIRGRNYYPQDIELTAEQSHAALRPNCGAAFTLDVGGEERVVFVQEVERQYRHQDLLDVLVAIRQAVLEEHELHVYAIALLKTGSIPKTSSGKIQRRACRAAFLAQQLPIMLADIPSAVGDLIAQHSATESAAHITDVVSIEQAGTAPTSEAAEGRARGAERKPMQFSLLYFSSNDAECVEDKYELLVEGAKFADQHGFTAVWVPERHFHPFGGLYPNPSVLASALAMVTQQIRLRAGSVVLPMHHPVRVVEEWAVVDNLSRGRVDLAFATGWNPNDFVLSPTQYANRRDILFSGIEIVHKLWRGESIVLPNGLGQELAVRVYPLPRQPELATWITCTGGRERFIEAGALGANVLTALLFQSAEELAEKIVAYREARALHGHDPATGHITLMLHTFVGEDMDEVREIVRQPFMAYLESSVDLWRHGIKKLDELSAQEREDLLAYAFERYFQSSALFGTPQTCEKLVAQFSAVGVDEIACLIDFGIAVDTVIDGLYSLNILRKRSQRDATGPMRPAASVLPVGPAHREASAPRRSETPAERRAPIGAPRSQTATAVRPRSNGQSTGEGRNGAASQPEFRMRLLVASDEQRLSLLEGYLRQQITRVLDRNVEEIADARSVRGLGLDSIMVVNVINQCQRDLHILLDAGMFYEHSSFDALARYVAESLQQAHGNGALETAAKTARPGLRRQERRMSFPLSLAQQRLWFLEQMLPGTPIYNTPIMLQLQGRLDLAALARSFNTVVQRHEALRTTFAVEDGHPVQVVTSNRTLAMPLVDLQALAYADRGPCALELATEEARRPFDLGCGPLIRVGVLCLDAEDHVLMLVGHHIVIDGWAIRVLLQEVASCYSAYVAGTPVSLPELALQYPDFAVWEREWMQEERLQDQLAYWKRHLAGAPAVLELPIDHPRPRVQQFHGACQSFRLPIALQDGLRQLSQREEVTLFMTLLAAFQVLLARYSGQDDIVVGMPIANRTRPELEGLIGFFANTLALRTDLRGNPSFAELLGRVREVCLGAYTHQDLPFERLIEELQPTRDPSHQPLFQVLFALQSMGLPTLELPGVTARLWDVDPGTARFELTISMSESRQGLLGTVEYNTDLFEGDTIARLVGHFQTVLEAVVADPLLRVRYLPLLTSAERQRLLVDSNQSAAAYPHDQCFHQLFEAQVARTPDGVALVCEEQQVSYAELNARANQLAHYLRRADVGPETRVGLCMERSAGLLIGLLGILKAGGAYVPLDPGYPQERRAFILADAHVALLITTADGETRSQGDKELDPLRVSRSPDLLVSRPVVRLDADWPVIAACSTANPASAVVPDNLAYVIYTSGSMGWPKGVLVAQRGLSNLAAVEAHAFDLSPECRVLQLASFSFDASMWDVVMALLFGGCLCIATGDARLPGVALTRLLQTQAITHATLAPSVLAALPADGLPALTILTSTGEAVTTDVVRRWAPGRHFFNGYGPTESTIGATLGECFASDSAPHIGQPFLNTQVYLLDAQMQPVPVGMPGELYVGGVGLARGYLHRPDLTAGRFVPNPFAEVSGAGCQLPEDKLPDTRYPTPVTRLYKTGDLARYRADGSLEYLGRIDHQVKLRGFRIELGEIEMALIRHPAVQDAVALVREDSPGEKRLVVYVVPGVRGQGSGSEDKETRRQGDKETEAPVELLTPDPRSLIPDLRAFLSERLPEYMVPSAFVVLDALPLTPNRKVDRRALPPPELSRHGLETDYAPPQTATERVLADIWAQVLGQERVGLHDNFFALGGDSILSIQIVARATQTGLPLAPRQLFHHQTVAALAAAVQSPRPQASVAAAQQFVTGPVLLSPIQHWFFAQALPAPHHFNQAMLLRLRMPLDPARLEQALRHLLVHHDALRLRFIRGAAGWRQDNAGLEGLDGPLLTIKDLTAQPLDQQPAALEAAATQAQGSLDLASGRLLHAVHFTLGSGQGERLLLVIHHLAVDGVSWRILLEDLQTAYQQLAQGQPVQLPAKTTAFQVWANQLYAYAQRAEVAEQAAYWLAIATNAETPLAITSVGEPSVRVSTQATAATVQVALSVEQTQALLHVVPLAYRTQINDVLLTALGLTLAPWTGTRRLLIDLEGHGREDLFADVDLSRSVGWYTTIFPVLLDLGPDDGLGPLLKRIKEQIRQVPQRGLSYGLLRYLRADPHLAEQLQALPPAAICFNYLGQFDQAFGATALWEPAIESPGAMHSPSTPRAYVLEINALVRGGQLQVSWTYDTALHERATIAALAGQFLQHLQALIADCQDTQPGSYTPSDFPLARLDQATLDQILCTTRQIEDLYPLSPMQQGMLFHALYAPASGVYVVQVTCELAGELDVTAFQHAWTEVVARHTILRTSFHRFEQMVPLQLVHPQVTLAWVAQDWRDLSDAAQQAQIKAFLEADRARGFDLAGAPLLRLSLLRLADDMYQFVWTHHHLVIDGWSLPVVLSEVFAFYAAQQQGRASALPPTRPYRDYIAWLQQQDMAQAEVFWRQYLADFLAPTPLPIEDTPLLAAQDADTGTAAVETLVLSEAMTAALQQFTRRHQLTLSTLIQATWALLLSRYCGERDVVFGLTVSGRPPELPGVETMVGLFINTLPVRVPVALEAPVIAWLQQMQALSVELRQYEYTPLVQAQGWSDLPRSMALFESILVFENYPSEQIGIGLDGITIQQMRATEQTNYPLTLVASPGQALQLRLMYGRDRFAAATVRRLAGQIRTLLEALAAEHQRQVGQLPLLTAVEQRQLLVDWNQPQASYATVTSLTARFEAQVSRTPDAVALVFDQTNDERRRTKAEDSDSAFSLQPSAFSVHMTYAALNARANQLAHFLRQHGLGPETPVGLLLDRTPALIVGLLAILKAGGAYLPLDPTTPPDRVARLCAESGMPFLLTQTTLAARLPDTLVASLTQLCLDQLAPTLARQPIANLALPISATQLAYVIYTSGSTGTPKGVLVPHGQVLRLFAATAAWGQFTARDVWTLFHSIAFDFSVWEVWGALLHGGRLVIVPYLLSRAPAELYALLAREQVTVLNQTPTAFYQLSAVATCVDVPRLRQLRLVIFGGEALAVEQLADWWLRYGEQGPQLVNMYGITETTVHVTARALAPAERAAGGSPIGRPLADLQVYVLDGQLQPVPIGALGELYVGGAGLARGYLGRPDLTAERFVPNPFVEVSGIGYRVSEDKVPDTRYPTPDIRLYKTGDLVRWQPDHTLVFLGRRDQQVKLRGFRIELGEIAATLRSHPAIQAAVVLAHEDRPGDARLVAYVVPGVRGQGPGSEDKETRRQGDKEEPNVTWSPSHLVSLSLITELRAFLKQRLPDYMIPSTFMFLDALPLTPNGKLDRRALPHADRLRPDSVSAYKPPQTPAQAVLADIWQQVLGLEQVGIYDNFFTLGGHSLLATLAQTRLRAAFAVDLPLRCLFEAPTLAALADQLESLQRIGAGLGDAAGPLVPQPRPAELPLSFAQQRLWFLDQWEPGTPLYNIAGAVRLEGELQVAALARSMQPIIQRHDSMRTTFASDAGRSRQVIAPSLIISVPLIDLADVPANQRERLAIEIANRDAQRPFDLVRGPLLRTTLVRLAAQAHLLLVSMHHIIADGWSLEVFMRELSAFYTAAVGGQPATLPDLPIQYADYALWQRDWLQGTVLERQISYWRAQLAGAPAVLALTDRPQPDVLTFRGASHAFVVPIGLLEDLRRLSQQAGVTLFMTLLAAFQVLLAYTSGQDDIVVGTPIAGRTRPEFEELIGFFVNTLVLRTRLDGDPTFVQLLGRVREVCLGAYAHQDLPFERLVYALQPQRSASHLPLFQVWFVLQDAPLASVDLPGVTLQPLMRESVTARYNLRLDIVQRTDGLYVVFEYKTDLFEAATITRMAEHYATILKLVATQADLKLSALTRMFDSAEEEYRSRKEQEAAEYSVRSLKYANRKRVVG